MDSEKQINIGFQNAQKAVVDALKAGEYMNEIPENLFRIVFLPMFADLKEKHIDGKPENWISIAGSQFHSVRVVDENKNLLFIVPPIFFDAGYKTVVERSESLNSVVSIAKLLSTRSPIEAENYINNKLSDNFRKNINIEGLKTYFDKWKIIFDFYQLTKKKEKSTEVKKQELGDFDEFLPI